MSSNRRRAGIALANSSTTWSAELATTTSESSAATASDGCARAFAAPAAQSEADLAQLQCLLADIDAQAATPGASLHLPCAQHALRPPAPT